MQAPILHVVVNTAWEQRPQQSNGLFRHNVCPSPQSSPSSLFPHTLPRGGGGGGKTLHCRVPPKLSIVVAVHTLRRSMYIKLKQRANKQFAKWKLEMICNEIQRTSTSGLKVRPHMLHGWKSVCCVGTSYSIWETRVGEDGLLHGWEKITEFKHSTIVDLSARFNGDLMHYWSGRQTRPNWS